MPSDQDPTPEQISQVKNSILQRLEKEPPAGKLGQSKESHLIWYIHTYIYNPKNRTIPSQRSKANYGQ